MAFQSSIYDYFIHINRWSRANSVSFEWNLIRNGCQERYRLTHSWSGYRRGFDFWPQDTVAKQRTLFAESRPYGFYSANGPHLNNSGGLLHLTGSNHSILHILPFWQMGQTVTSIPQILSNCSCQVSCLELSFFTVLPSPIILWHAAMLSLRFLFASRPKWRIRT